MTLVTRTTIASQNRRDELLPNSSAGKRVRALLPPGVVSVSGAGQITGMLITGYDAEPDWSDSFGTDPGRWLAFSGPGERAGIDPTAILAPKILNLLE